MFKMISPDLWSQICASRKKIKREQCLPVVGIRRTLVHKKWHRTVLTYSMEQSPPWQANRFLFSQEIPRILWNPEGSLPRLQVPFVCPYPEPDQFSPCPPSHFQKINLNIIIPPTSGTSK